MTEKQEGCIGIDCVVQKGGGVGKDKGRKLGKRRKDRAKGI